MAGLSKSQYAASQDNKIVVDALGSGGVNLVKSPYHLDNNELTNAQNAIPDRSGGMSSIRKRDGLTAIGPDLGTTCHGIVNVGLDDPSNLTSTLYAACGTASGSIKWKTSTDGSSWSNSSALAVAQTQAQMDTVFTFPFKNTRVAALDGRLLYPSSGYTVASGNPILVAWDGTNNPTIATILYNKTSGSTTFSVVILDSVIHKGELYISVFDPGGSDPNQRGRVFRVNTITGELTQIGSGFSSSEIAGGMPVALCSYNGLLWAGLYGISTPGAATLLHYINPDVPVMDWVADTNSTGISGFITSIREYLGELYIGIVSPAGTAARVYRRTPVTNSLTAATWTATDTAAGTGAANYYTVLGSNAGLLYAGYHDAAGGACYIRQFNGSAWTTTFDIGAAFSVTRKFGQAARLGANLYVAMCATTTSATDGFVFNITTGAKALDAVNLRGYLTVLER